MRRYDHDHTPNVYINLGDFGAPGYHEISQLEMSMLYSAAQRIQDESDPEDAQAWLERTESLLLQYAAANSIDEDWIGLAVLCLAVRGIRYGEIPDCIFVED